MALSLYVILLVGFALTPGSYGQGEVTGTTEGSNKLQPWLVGLAAVVGFLGLMFVASLVNRIFFSNKTKDEPNADKDIELRTKPNIYDNIAVDLDEEGPSKVEEGPSSEAKVDDKNLTSM
ncbi:small integral membrane protein 24 [Sceloporus undulatus]|uniref:small integral membrane protein 24 n=1 Tax=Sceloporus undulatus TaxID=8520 RepID=UPI001C4AB1E2|nr:small integral membrane protein 24 [Sceloporus undulatus]